MGNEGGYSWWQTGVVYQIYPRSFQDSNGDGIGDLAGILRRLDYLSGTLGIDAIWLSPFYPSPMADFGYDVADFTDVDPIFGDLATFDRLVEEAHHRGVRVIIDYVPNHTSDQHPWFLESRSSLQNPKRDWYIWRHPQPDGSPPNNWGSFFGGPAWTYDPETGQYYLHQFVKGQPELNWRNPQVRVAMLDVLRFWMRRGVDGFRMDVVGLLIKDAQFRDNPPNPHARQDLPANDLHGRQLHVYTEDQDEVHGIIREIRRTLDEFPERCGIGELWGSLPRWVRYYGENADELHLPFNFRLMDQPWQAESVRRSVDELEASLPPFGWPNYVLGNHDRPRLASRIGGQAPARLAAMLLLTLRGTPTIYYGEEIGMQDVTIPPEKIQDPQGINLGASRTRDVARTPMQWDSGVHAGFSPLQARETWLPLAPDYRETNVERQLANPASMLSLYRQLLAYRRVTPALQVGSYQPLDGVPEDCFAYLRRAAGQSVLVVLNFANQPVAARLEHLGRGQVRLSTHLDLTGPVSVERLELRPFEGLVVELEGEL